jgi:hypothetical protein
VSFVTDVRLDDFASSETFAHLTIFVARFGQVNQHIRISPHVKYDRLSRLVMNIIQVKMKKEDAQLQKCLNMFNDSRSTQFRSQI